MRRSFLGLLLGALTLLAPAGQAAVCGDLNGDNSVGIADASMVLRFAVGLSAPTAEQTRLADFNRDNAVTIADATLALQGAVGLTQLESLCAPAAGGSIVTTVVGDPDPMANGPTASARFQLPSSIDVDSQGNLIVADLNNHAIRQITPQGVVSTLAGNGISGFRDGPAGQALIGDIWAIEVGPDDTIYFSDSSNLRIRKLSKDRTTVSTLAGNPELDENGFAIPARQDGPGNVARFMFPIGLAVDPNGNVYVADVDDQTIRKITPEGVVSTVAGNQQYGFQDGDALSASFRFPLGLALASNGDLYISDFANELIRVLTPEGQVTTFAGNPRVVNGEPVPGYEDGPGDQAQFGSPRGIAFGGDTLYVADADMFSTETSTERFVNSRIRAVSPAGEVSTLAGQGQFGIDNGKGTAATFRVPYDVAALPDGTVYVADVFNNAIRRIAPDGTVTTLAGKPPAGFRDGRATEAELDSPQFMAGDGQGNFYIADYGNNRIRKLSRDGTVTTVAGQDYTIGAEGFLEGGFTEGPAATAQIFGPTSVAAAADGSLYFTDRENHAIRKIDASGNLTTFAGTGEEGFADGPGDTAQFFRPRFLAFGPDGNLYVSDTFNHRIRKITPAGVVSTVAGGGTEPGYADGTPSSARFGFPQGMAIAADGTIYVADIHNHMVRKIAPNGNVTTLSGNPTLDENQVPLGGYQDGPGEEAQFDMPGAIVLLTDGSLLVSDRGNNRIRKIASNGTTTTIAGIFDSGFWDGPVESARFDGPFGLALDTDGTLLIAEEYNHRVRRLKF